MHLVPFREYFKSYFFLWLLVNAADMNFSLWLLVNEANINFFLWLLVNEANMEFFPLVISE